MTLRELSSYLDSVVPLSFQEDYDNAGLQVGIPESEIHSALLTIDVTEGVIDEAIDAKIDLIISHHPLIFSGIKKLTGKSYVERVLLKAIKNNIAVYSAHTNLDISSGAVSRKMAEKLGLINIKVLAPLKSNLLKLVVYVPESHIEKVRSAIFSAGAGITGNYDNCGFVVNGTGSFRGNENSNPFTGLKGELHYEKEIRFETVLYSHLKSQVVKAMLEAHPYEEVAYDIFLLQNDDKSNGLGCTGEFKESLKEKDFLNLLSHCFNEKGIRYSELTGKGVKKVALCGGAGSSLLSYAISSAADAFVTGDIKYHNFFDADKKILLVDTGHFESEKYSTEILYDLIIKKFPKFALRFSETNTNPINYL
jgi:dinuclear metal center YbgI/SA1388 family protein